jgi:NAD(P)-dependent dehydrogenase (short-subunit alcohol dehydrogenase family)
MTRTAQINAASVFLVSGGARGVTAQCVMKLAQTYPCQWILLGRSPLIENEPVWAQGCDGEADLKKRIMQAMIAQGTKPTPPLIQREFNQITAQREIRATLAAIRQSGRTVEYLSADVTDAADLQRQLAPVVERLGAVTGIIHGAGNLADKLIEKKTEQDFERVYAAKVQGLENLFQCVPVDQLEYLVLFASVAGFYGNAGQSDYALANEILNKSAHLIKQRHPSCHVVSVNWGPWDSGMVTPELKRVFAERKIDVIPLDVGAQMLVDELKANRHDDAQIVIGSSITPSATPPDGELRTYRIHRHLTLAANPFLQGQPELPLMVAASWLIRSCEQLYPGYELDQLEHFQVVKTLVCGQSAELFTVDIQEVSKSEGDLRFGVVVWTAVNGKAEVYYQGQVKLRTSLQGAIAPMQPSTISSQKSIPVGKMLRGIEQVLELTGERILLQCRSPQVEERHQGQFLVNTFNPFAAETLGYALQLWQDQFDPSSLSIQGFQRLEQFKPLPFAKRYFLLAEVTRTEEGAIATLTAQDPQGEVYLRVTGVQIAVSQKVLVAA